MLEHGVRRPPLPIHLAGRFPPPTSSLIWEQRPDVQGLTHSLLSGSSMMLESSCGQRETASTRYHSQTSGCLLASALTHHVWSARPFSLSSLPQASPTFKKKTTKKKREKKPQLPTLSSHHPLPLSVSQAPGMSHLYHPVTPPPTATSFCPILPPVPPPLGPQSPMNERPNH